MWINGLSITITNALTQENTVLAKHQCKPFLAQYLRAKERVINRKVSVTNNAYCKTLLRLLHLTKT